MSATCTRRVAVRSILCRGAHSGRAPAGGALRYASVCVLALACVAPRAHAQDFVPAEPAGPSASASSLLDRGLPAPGRFDFEALTTSWLGVPGLVTRGVCATAAVRSVRVAAGVAQTGEAPAGWLATGVAVGATGDGFGAAVRAVARRDLDASLGPRSRDAVEAGGGAWLRAAPGVLVWARAPQLATAGPSPPLARALATGVSVEHDGVGAWFEREAPARTTEEAGTHAAGVWLRLDPAQVWIEGRGRPLRAGFGLMLAGISVRAIGHPRLGDTVTLALSFPARRLPP